jgi:hypothetical protein
MTNYSISASAPNPGYYRIFYGADGKCIGGEANNPECEWNYTGSFRGTDIMYLPENFNPIGKSYKELKAIRTEHENKKRGFITSNQRNPT